jgi:hypothetical protein
MNPYRQTSKPETSLSPRWGVSFWKKLYVKIARTFIDLKYKYRYDRRYRHYLRRLAEWNLELEAFRNNKTLKPKAFKPIPLMPPRSSPE